MRVVVPRYAVERVKDCLDVVVQIATKFALRVQIKAFDYDGCAFGVDDDVNAYFARELRPVPRFLDLLLGSNGFLWRVSDSTTAFRGDDSWSFFRVRFPIYVDGMAPYARTNNFSSSIFPASPLIRYLPHLRSASSSIDMASFG